MSPEPIDSNQEPLVLSIDAGGTKTAACIARIVSGQPSVIGRARGGPANVTTLGVQPVLAEFERTIMLAIRDAGLQDTRFDDAVVSLAGGGDARSCVEVKRWLTETLCDQAKVVSDAEMALLISESTHPDAQQNIGLLVGTGSIAFSRVKGSDEIYRAGGWGSIIGDDGSGYWIGREAIRSVLQEADQGNAPGRLAEAILQSCAAETMRELITKVTDTSNQAERVASFTPIVLDEAEHGDELAMRVLELATNHIASLIDVSLKRSSIAANDTAIACAGSLITRESVFSKLVAERIQTIGVRRLKLIDDPVVEALCLCDRSSDAN